MTDKEYFEQVWRNPGVLHACHITRWEDGRIARPGRINTPLRDKKAWARIRKNAPNYARNWK